MSTPLVGYIEPQILLCGPHLAHRLISSKDQADIITQGKQRINLNQFIKLKLPENFFCRFGLS